ncbi:MAG TPA: sigma-70 family RNA polymerase sigma factor [Phycisphaerales bacterium]|nr:sigma-70 family RNA polymerase sigma factor [Phycisphaerales bacterium]
MLEDKLLVWKLRRGSKDALRAIYEKYRDDLLRIAAGLLRERGLAEDVVHEVFIAFAASAASFTLTGSLRGYLTTCVANKARNINRTMSRQKTVGLDEIDPPVSGMRRPDEWIIYDEQFQQVCSAMAQLPFEQSEAVVLRIQGAMKFRDIAKLQQTSTKTALSRYRYGLDKLRSILKSEVIK